ncbi:MAG: hypothetical protein HRT52_24070, partial [Colwellia sp.]|nr:hypothetical protein [Colwellia sp.]
MSTNSAYEQLGNQTYRKICHCISCFFFRCLPTIITLVISTVTCAQSFHSSVERISTNSALPDITIYSLIEDDSGFLWLGTPKGLVRYDGNQFQVYSSNSDNAVTLQSDDSSNIFIDSKQRMWIGTWGEGLYLYDKSMNFIAHFVHNVEDQHSINSHFIQALFEDSDGNIWVGTNGGGLSIYNNESQNFTNFINDPDNDRSLSNNRVWSISESAGKVIWVGTTHGLNRFVLKEPGIFTRYHHDDNNRYSLDDSLIRSLLVDKKGNLWIGTESGFGLFDIETERFIRINPSENQSLAPITRIREGKRGNIWIGTQKGIYRYEPVNKKYTALVSGQNYKMFPRDDIRDIVVDKSGLLWVSTRYAGLIRLKFSAKTFNEYNSFESVSAEIEDFSNVTAMVEDHDGVLWLGSSEGLLFRKGTTDKFHKYNDN